MAPMQRGEFKGFLVNPKVRRRSFYLWLTIVLAWSITRTLLIAHVFERYGLNIPLYFAIDFLSSIPYAFTSAKTFNLFLSHQRTAAMKWGVTTVLFFYLPDIYIVVDAKDVPPHTYIGFGVILIFLSTLAIGQWRERR